MKQQMCLLAAMAALGFVSSDKSQSIGAESAQANPATNFFVSSTGSKTANLGGLSGADKTCQGSAVGLGNKTWRAYLSVGLGPGGDPAGRYSVGTRHMTMGAAPIPDRAEAADGSTASRRNRRAASHLFAASREKGSTAYHT